MRDRRGYSYRSYRDGGQVKREYLGKGRPADLAEQLIGAQRLLRQEQAKADREKMAELASLDETATRIDRVYRLVAEAFLLEMGCYRHRRQWRMSKKKNPAETTPAAAPLPASDDPQTWTDEEMHSILARGQAGDQAVLRKLRLAVRACPGLVSRLTLDLATAVREALAERFAPADLLAQQCLIARIEQMADGLAGPGATALERLLADQIATALLHQQWAENLALLNSKGSLSVALGTQRWLSLAQKRTLAAVGMLARVRKLAGVSLRLDLAEQQVNVAGRTLPLPTVRKAALPAADEKERERAEKGG